MSEENSIKDPLTALTHAYCDVIDAAAAIVAEICWFAPKVREPLAFRVSEDTDLYDLTSSIHNIDMLDPEIESSISLQLDLLSDFKNKAFHQAFFNAPVAVVRNNIGNEIFGFYRKFYLFSEDYKGGDPAKVSTPCLFYPKHNVKVMYQLIETTNEEHEGKTRMPMLDRLINSVQQFSEAAELYRNAGPHTESKLLIALNMILKLFTCLAIEMRLYSYKYRDGSEPLGTSPDFNELDGMGRMLIKVRTITSSLRGNDPQLIYSTAKTIIKDLHDYEQLTPENPFAKPDLMSSASGTVDKDTSKLIRLYVDKSKIPGFMKKALSHSPLGKIAVGTFTIAETVPQSVNRLYMVKMGINVMKLVIHDLQTKN